MPTPYLVRALSAALLLTSALAHAQYAWIDAKGVRHYSDQPPPVDTPAAKIVKAPRASMPPTPSAAEATKPAPTLAEREADYRKRHAASDEADKKAAADKQLADTKRANCQAAAENKAQIETGRRMRSGSANDVMSEADKARDIARADAVLKDCR